MHDPHHHGHARRHARDPHGHEHGHVLGLARLGGGRIHRLDRRRFLTELGRNTFAVAILGGVAASCSNDDGATAPSATEPEVGAADATATGVGGASSSPSATADPTATSAPGSADGAPAATTGDAATAEALRWAQVSLGFVSAYVLVRGNRAAVVDTGTSGSADAIGATLADLGVTFDDVGDVILTHHHPDHIGSLPAVLDRAGSATAYAGVLDLPNIPVDAIGVADGDDVFGLQVIETPGHTPGSISVLDTGIGLLIAGDALNGDDGTGIGGPNPDFTADMDTATASVARLADLSFETAAFGHGQPVLSGADALVRALTG